MSKENTMRYKVKTDQLANYKIGDTVKGIDMDGTGFPCLPKEVKGISKEIIERNPDWFQPIEEFKKGQWVWSKQEQEVIGKIARKTETYYESNGNGYEEYCIDDSMLTGEPTQRLELKYNIRKATPDEIEQALIKEAKRRGFDVGKKVKTPRGFEHQIEHDSIDYSPNQDSMFIGGPMVYKQGQWAKIIDQTPDIEINGKTITVEDGEIKISCGDTIDEEMFKQFYALVNKYDLQVSRNGERINDQLQQIWDEVSKMNGTPIKFTIEVDETW